MQIRVWVLGQTCDGPTLFDTLICCNQKAYDEGDHYDLAKDRALDAGLEAPMIAFDENDPAGRVLCKT